MLRRDAHLAAPPRWTVAPTAAPRSVRRDGRARRPGPPGSAGRTRARAPAPAVRGDAARRGLPGCRVAMLTPPPLHAGPWPLPPRPEACGEMGAPVAPGDDGDNPPPNLASL